MALVPLTAEFLVAQSAMVIPPGIEPGLFALKGRCVDQITPWYHIAGFYLCLLGSCVFNRHNRPRGMPSTLLGGPGSFDQPLQSFLGIYYCLKPFRISLSTDSFNYVRNSQRLAGNVVFAQEQIILSG